MKDVLITPNTPHMVHMSGVNSQGEPRAIALKSVTARADSTLSPAEHQDTSAGWRRWETLDIGPLLVETVISRLWHGF